MSFIREPIPIQKQIKLGFNTFFEAIPFIFTNGLAWTFVVPVLLNVILFVGGFSLTESVTNSLQTWIVLKINSAASNFFLFEYLPGFISWIIWILTKVIFFFVFAFYGGFITLFLLSPLLAFVSEKTEEKITGIKTDFNITRFLKDIFRGMFIAVRNVFLETVWIVLLFIVGFIPFIGWLGFIPLFLISAYFYGFSFMDYSCERKRMGIPDGVIFIRSNKWFAITMGVMFCIFLLIPFVGVFLSGFVAIVSVVAATKGVYEINTSSY